MLIGQYNHTLDDKSRVTVPSAYRDSLAKGAIILQGLDKNLMVMTSSFFDTIYNRINSMNLADPDVRNLKRVFYSNAFPIELDKAGRIMIPQKLRTFLGSANELTLVGQGSYFEIWNAEVWGKLSESLEDADQNAIRFKALDLSVQSDG